ncbi:hypothetical protein BD779DRAFT_1676578 [Infundibulicybe gibba]|nr:hypothetical protein BD779DRAFT_1676578 [Infundibulicybe gibba]
MSTRITRASNKNAHPGLPDVDEVTLSKRTSAQVKVDATAKRQAKADEKIVAGVKKNTAAKAIAMLEDRMLTEDTMLRLNAANPTPNPAIKTPRELVEPDESDDLSDVPAEDEVAMESETEAAIMDPGLATVSPRATTIVDEDEDEATAMMDEDEATAMVDEDEATAMVDASGKFHGSTVELHRPDRPYRPVDIYPFT